MTGRAAPEAKRLLKYCAPSIHALENLKNAVLFCQHYACFNDPFEFWTRVVRDIPDQDKSPERFRAAMRAWGFLDEEPQSDEDSREYFDEVQNYQPPFELMLDHMRIACFASEDDNLLMWSHYADGMRGFCIAFDEEVLVEAEPEGYVMDVAYFERPPVVDAFVYAIAWDQQDYHLKAIDEVTTLMKYLGKGSQGEIDAYQQAADEALAQMQLIWRNMFGAKPKEWEYEHERRLLIQSEKTDRTPFMHGYPRSAIREIIFGERVSADFLAQLRSAIAEFYPEVPVRMASRSADEYAIHLSEPL